MNPATTLANWLVTELIQRGVTQAVLCPGSRNAPLSFALERSPITVHTRIDERTAGFLALGIAKTSRRPVVVVTTSGTAAANLHPAVLEAAHAGVRLVVLSADRPMALRGTGANQTTDQRQLYGTAAGFADLDRVDPQALAAAWESPGPVQLNVCFAEPLLPDEQVTHPAISARTPAEAEEESVALDPGKRTVVVAGDDAGPAARRLAQAANWPLLAEPSSGARTGPALRTYRLLLDRLGAEVERAVVFGHPTLSRPVQQLLARTDVEVVSIRTRGRWPKRPFPIRAEYDAVSAIADDPAWLHRWQQADADLSARIDQTISGWGFTPYDVAREVLAALPPGGLLMVGASNPIRDLDLMGTPTPVGERRMVIANRGLAGIDGTVSTAIGAALGRPGSTRAIAYLGDVTFLHDLNGLLLGPTEQRPDLTIVVANDDGGSIFATLEQGAPEYAHEHERLFATPHGADLAHLCAGLGVVHQQVRSTAELRAALAPDASPTESPNPTPSPDSSGIRVVEAAIDRNQRRAWDRTLKALITS